MIKKRKKKKEKERKERKGKKRKEIKKVYLNVPYLFQYFSRFLNRVDFTFANLPNE